MIEQHLIQPKTQTKVAFEPAPNPRIKTLFEPSLNHVQSTTTPRSKHLLCTKISNGKDQEFVAADYVSVCVVLGF